VAPLIPHAERRHVRIDAVDGPLRVHVTELGEGPPALLLHGWPQHAGAWRKVAPLMADRHRLICPDLRGFGSTEAPGRNYDAQTFASDALALLDALELDQAFLMGHDWGGFAGYLACFAAPQRIRAYVSLNAPIPWLKPSPRLLAGFWRAWYVLVMASPLGPRVLERRPARVAAGIKGDTVHSGISWQESIDYAVRLARPGSRRATQLLYRSYLRSLVDAVRDEPPPRLTVPTRVLFGAQDTALSTAVVKGWEGHADDMQVELVEDSGHFIAEEQPELVAERALQLFSSTSSPEDASSRTGAP
jgi:pimeloyl-ACP methyl ester carboxylesterase